MRGEFTIGDITARAVTILRSMGTSKPTLPLAPVSFTKEELEATLADFDNRCIQPAMALMAKRMTRNKRGRRP